MAIATNTFAHIPKNAVIIKPPMKCSILSWENHVELFQSVINYIFVSDCSGIIELVDPTGCLIS
jgi:hypothetical protein